MAKNSSASVPAQLSISLAKIALAGPVQIAATASTTAILTINVKLIVAAAIVAVLGAIAIYHW
jgi:hypothetical protein